MALNAKELRGTVWTGLVCTGIAGVAIEALIEGLVTGVMHGRYGARHAWLSEPGAFAGCAALFAVIALVSLAGVALAVLKLLKGPYRPSLAELEQARAETPPVVRPLR